MISVIASLSRFLIHLFLTNLSSIVINFCIACFPLGLNRTTLGLEGWDWSAPLELGEFSSD